MAVGERRYQEEVNRASIDLAIEDPTLLNSRKTLLKLAREKVNESGYRFKKGKSRSKLYHTDESTPKRPKISEAIRETRIDELQEDIKDIVDRIGYKEKMRERASMARNYKLCDQLTEEMSELKPKRRLYEKELQEWNRKKGKAEWYRKKIKGKARAQNRATALPVCSPEESGDLIELQSDAFSSRSSTSTPIDKAYAGHFTSPSDSGSEADFFSSSLEDSPMYHFESLEDTPMYHFESPSTNNSIPTDTEQGLLPMLPPCSPPMNLG